VLMRTGPSRRSSADGTAVHSMVTTAFGHRIHARFAGHATARRPVILVHGIGVSSRYMLPLLRPMAGYASVYALDLSGFGLSTKPTSRTTYPGWPMPSLHGWTPSDSATPSWWATPSGAR
jgi:pimeloyl-ACP methyl ester carboxylesterase